jgi:AraC-like DNA-binding protein
MPRALDKWQPHRSLLDATHELRLVVNHAQYGRIPRFCSSNCLPENRLYFCLDDCGRISWICGGRRMSLRLPAASITFMPGAVEITYDFTPGRMAAFHFNMEIFPGLDVFAGEAGCRQMTGQRQLCRSLLSHMEAGRGLSRVLRVHSMLFQAAGDFCGSDLGMLRQQILLRKKYAGLLDILEDRLDATLSVGELADNLKLTRDKLSKAFRRDLGISLKHYLAARLTRKASRLLTVGMNVRETATELRFGSEFYFSRFFRKQTGRSPSVFRKEYSNL